MRPGTSHGRVSIGTPVDGQELGPLPLSGSGTGEASDKEVIHMCDSPKGERT